MGETKLLDRARRFYFDNVESRDAELIRLRDTAYKGDTGSMLRVYSARINHPNADIKVLQDDIKRLQAILSLETLLLPRLNMPYNGGVLTTMSPLVEKYELERKKSSVTTSRIETISKDATPHSQEAMLKEFYCNEVIKSGEDVDLLVECATAWGGDLGKLRQSYDARHAVNGCSHDMKRIERLIDLQTGLDELNLKHNNRKVDLVYLVQEFESERLAQTPKNGTQVVRKYFGTTPTGTDGS